MFDINKFNLRFPEFANTEPALIELLAEDAVAIIGDMESHWCGQYQAALAYLTAHLLSFRQLQQAEAESGSTSTNKSGPVTAKSAGGVSVTYAAPGSSFTKPELFYSKTPYGEHFLLLRHQCFGATGFVASGPTPPANRIRRRNNSSIRSLGDNLIDY